MNIVLLLIGFVLLIKGADILVEGSSNIAKALKIPTIIIGLTIVAFGTSAPELAVSLKSALAGSPDIATGNIAGSSIFNLLLVVGLTALLKNIEVEKPVLKTDFPFLILVTFVVTVICGDVVFSNGTENVINRGDGIVLLSFFAIFMFYLIRNALQARNTAIEEAAITIDAGAVPQETEKHSMVKDCVFVLLGLAGVILGGNWVVESSKEIAISLGMSETLVGLTIVAMGTSLPELVTSVVAAKKGESEMAIGNVIGSNIFNLLLVLGATSTIAPIHVNGDLITDMLYLLAISIIAFLVMKVRNVISKKEGVLFTFLYVIYAVFIIWRNYSGM